jgi:mannosyltransferase OCH1-like enzyme
MKNLPPINGLWFGNPLSTLEIMSMTSFLRNGHEYNLYTYHDLKDIPYGVNIKDANEIVPESEIFRALDSTGKPGGLGAFSDYFRYNLVYKMGGFWADTDCICIKPWDWEEEYIFSSENTHRGEQESNAGVIKAPINSPLMKICLDKFNEYEDKTKIPWGDVGPILLRNSIKNYKLEKYVKSWKTFCPINWWDIDKCFTPNLDFTLTEETYCIHINNEIIRRLTINKNDTFHSESIYEQLKKWIFN